MIRPREPFMVRAGGFIGLGAAVTTGFMYFWSVAAVPWYVSLFLVPFWLVHFFLACMWFERHPRLSGWYLPIVLPAVWFAVVLGGALRFDWAL